MGLERAEIEGLELAAEAFANNRGGIGYADEGVWIFFLDEALKQDGFSSAHDGEDEEALFIGVSASCR